MLNKSILTIMDLLQVINSLYEQIGSNIAIDAEGWPIFESEHYAVEWPQIVVPYTRRNNPRIIDKTQACLCLYAPDSQIYPRFVNIAREIETYQQYAAVITPDITVTQDMDLALQETIMLANYLFAAVLASNGIKLVFNTRCGVQQTQQRFRNIPGRIMCASGFLGCSSSVDIYSATPYINKILGLRPSKLLIYGKHDMVVDGQLDLLGVNYRYYEDFHMMSKRRAA